jgi:SAM-dependent methyltransferase
VTHACQNCDSTDVLRLYTAAAFDNGVTGRDDAFALGRCRQCHLVSATDVTAQTLDAAYASDYYGTPKAKFSGVMLRAFQARGADVLGLERDQFDIPADMAGDIVAGTITDPHFEERRFDIVLLWHVLEHLDHAGALLAEVAAHTSEGALLVIAVPNYGSIQQQFFRDDWFHLDLPRHILHFDAAWLVDQLEQSGFDVELESHLDVVQGPYGFIQSALNRVCPASEFNGLYAWLKRAQRATSSPAPTVAKWLILAAVLAPFALAEALFAAFAHRGACVTIVARRRRGR